MKINKYLISDIHDRITEYLHNTNKQIDPHLGLLELKDLFGIIRNNKEENGIHVTIELKPLYLHDTKLTIFELVNNVLVKIELILNKEFNIKSSKLDLNYKINRGENYGY